MNPVISINDLNTNDIVITKLKFDKNKRPTAAFINVKNKPACVAAFESCTLNIAFEPNYFGENDEKKNIPEEQRNYTMVARPYTNEISSDSEGSDPNKELELMMSFLENLKDKAIDFGIENSKEILKKKFTPDQREIMADTSFSYPFKPKTKPDGTLYPVSISIKVPKNKDNNPDVPVFRKLNNNIEEVKIYDWDTMKQICAPNTKFRAILKPIISIVNKNVYFTLRLVQMLIYAVEKAYIPKTYAFSDASKYNIAQNTTKMIETETEVISNDGMVVDSEEENNSEVEVNVEED